jgi:hypothetical protein
MVSAAGAAADLSKNPNRRRFLESVLAQPVTRDKGPLLQPMAPAVQNARAGARYRDVI